MTINYDFNFVLKIEKLNKRNREKINDFFVKIKQAYYWV